MWSWIFNFMSWIQDDVSDLGRGTGVPNKLAHLMTSIFVTLTLLYHYTNQI